MPKQELVFTVNGQACVVDVEPRDTLLEVLRGPLQLYGTHLGCGTGDCGACTVLLNGAPVPSCLVLSGDADGGEVTTVEGLVRNGEPHPVQRSIVTHGGVQCGFCTPGIVMSSYALLQANPHPGEVEVREALAGNLCRCTGYQKIVEAIVELAR